MSSGWNHLLFQNISQFLLHRQSTKNTLSSSSNTLGLPSFSLKSPPPHLSFTMRMNVPTSRQSNKFQKFKTSKNNISNNKKYTILSYIRWIILWVTMSTASIILLFVLTLNIAYVWNLHDSVDLKNFTYQRSGSLISFTTPIATINSPNNSSSFFQDSTAVLLQHLATFISKSGNTNNRNNSKNNYTIRNNVKPEKNGKNGDDGYSEKVLALLYPPGLLGGYRNQVLRFMALVQYGIENNYTALFVPSMLWSTQLDSIGVDIPWYPIPFHWVFDVDYWNEHSTIITATASNSTTKRQVLPHLVDSTNVPSDCWIQPFHNKSFLALATLDDKSSTTTNRNNYVIPNLHTHSYRILEVLHVKNISTITNTSISTATMSNATNSNSSSNSVIASIINHLQRAALVSGAFQPLLNISYEILTNARKINPRSEDFLPLVQHCNNPAPYGGGIKAGRLWNDYTRFLVPKIQKRNANLVRILQKSQLPKESNVDNFHHSNVYHLLDDILTRTTPTKASVTDSNNGTTYSVTKTNDMFATDVWMYRALRPAQVWRDVAHQCVLDHTKHRSGRYIALHARVELEIMSHPCGHSMEKNLTTIMERIYHHFFLDVNQSSSSGTSSKTFNHKDAPTVSGLFVAVSRDGMEVPHDSQLYKKHQKFADENIRTLNILTGHEHIANDTEGGRDGQTFLDLLASIRNVLPVFECGRSVLTKYYNNNPNVPDHGSLLQSVLNFDIALNADIFVGVAGSSYSADILQARYYLGKGEQNYRYTTTGIVRVENNGLPQPHTNCKRGKT